jgi:hypothetical protein
MPLLIGEHVRRLSVSPFAQLDPAKEPFIGGYRGDGAVNPVFISVGQYTPLCACHRSVTKGLTKPPAIIQVLPLYWFSENRNFAFERVARF